MRRAWRSSICALVLLVSAQPLSAHDLERTQVSLIFSRDGSFVLDVANDPNWLKLRMEPFGDNFADRVVLWVDGHEIRATKVEFVPARGDGLAAYRLRGTMPIDARSLRWYYGLVIDPYPMTIRRADGRLQVEEIAGEAWSRPIDLSGQFERSTHWPTFAVVGLFLVVLGGRLAARVSASL